MVTAVDGRLRLRTVAEAAPEPIPASDFARTMRTLACGVVIVTSYVDERPWGVTLSSLSSFSADPARISFSIGRSTATAQSIAEQGSFGVAILAAGARDLAARMAAPGQPKFLPEDAIAGRGPVLGVPAVEGSLYNLECKSVFEIEVLDHLLVVADVVSATTNRTDESGLVFWNRGFGSFAHAEGDNA